MTQDNACLFLQNFVADCPFIIHTLLTDNGAQFTYRLLAEHLQPKNKIHPFDQVCLDAKIEHRLTKFRHPWTNGQVEIMNKVIKEHTVKRYHYETLESLKHHLMSFLLLYNHQRKLKALKYQTPYDKVLEIYQGLDDKNKTTFFKSNPDHKNMGLNKPIAP